jgi:hypothetical protein
MVQVFDRKDTAFQSLEARQNNQTFASCAALI